jgi:hypothetical protein
MKNEKVFTPRLVSGNLFITDVIKCHPLHLVMQQLGILYNFVLQAEARDLWRNTDKKEKKKWLKMLEPQRQRYIEAYTSKTVFFDTKKLGGVIFQIFINILYKSSAKKTSLPLKGVGLISISTTSVVSIIWPCCQEIFVYGRRLVSKSDVSSVYCLVAGVGLILSGPFLGLFASKTGLKVAGLTLIHAAGGVYEFRNFEEV